jgi:hypothetical protein
VFDASTLSEISSVTFLPRPPTPQSFTLLPHLIPHPCQPSIHSLAPHGPPQVFDASTLSEISSVTFGKTVNEMQVREHTRLNPVDTRAAVSFALIPPRCVNMQRQSSGHNGSVRELPLF